MDLYLYERIVDPMELSTFDNRFLNKLNVCNVLFFKDFSQKKLEVSNK